MTTIVADDLAAPSVPGESTRPRDLVKRSLSSSKIGVPTTATPNHPAGLTAHPLDRGLKRAGGRSPKRDTSAPCSGRGTNAGPRSTSGVQDPSGSPVEAPDGLAQGQRSGCCHRRVDHEQASSIRVITLDYLPVVAEQRDEFGRQLSWSSSSESSRGVLSLGGSLTIALNETTGFDTHRRVPRN